MRLWSVIIKSNRYRITVPVGFCVVTADLLSYLMAMEVFTNLKDGEQIPGVFVKQTDGSLTPIPGERNRHTSI